jgi:two-component system chemotaxis response regulator CheB
VTTRVLVVDDSVVVRRVVARALDAEPGFELAGVAANGSAALEKVAQLHPDAIVLDLDMPVMDGFQTIAALRGTHPNLPIIVFSHLTTAGATATLDALAAGATGFALKPSAAGIDLAQEAVRQDLLPLIAAVVPARVTCDAPPLVAASRPQPTTLPRAPLQAIVVAVSTGGPNALAELVPHIPANSAVPILIVQHMPPLFTQTLAQRLDKIACVDVVEASDTEPVVPGRIYIAPGGHHISVRRVGARACIELRDDPPENSCRPAADVLFRSAAQTYGDGVAAVVLTGMGSDGRRGCEAVHAAGGTVLTQDAASCVVSTMPTTVADAGLADAVLPLSEVGPTLARWIAEAGR